MRFFYEVFFVKVSYYLGKQYYIYSNINFPKMKKLIIPLLFLFFSMSQAQTVKTVSTDWTSISQTIAI